MAYEIEPEIARWAGPPPEAEGRPFEAWLEKFTGTSRVVAEELAVLGAAADDDLITIPDGRKLLAVDYVALKAFADANQFHESNIWRAVKRGRSGRVTAVKGFFWYQVTDITALSGCAELKRLYLDINRIADISALASCRELRQLSLGGNRIRDISALASCAKLDALFLEYNEIADVSALAGCSRLTTLNLQGNQLTNISGLTSLGRLAGLYLGENQIADVSALERCKGLWSVSLPGNPLAEGSEDVLMRLHERGVAVHY